MSLTEYLVVKTMWIFFNVDISSKVVNYVSLKHSCKNNMDIVQIFLCAEKRIKSYTSKTNYGY